MGVISGVSGEWQTWRGGKLDQFVRLDVSVYPTSTGGAVVDAEGGVIGIVSAGLSRSSVIAVTFPTIQRVAEVLFKKGHIARGYLGIGLQSVVIPNALQQRINVRQDAGVIALNVEESGPAARAGVLVGDVVLSVGEHVITGPDALHAVLDASAINKQLPLKILRGGALLELAVTIGERPGRGV
jgi:S1-C subfamily serine protease